MIAIEYSYLDSSGWVVGSGTAMLEAWPYLGRMPNPFSGKWDLVLPVARVIAEAPPKLEIGAAPVRWHYSDLEGWTSHDPAD